MRSAPGAPSPEEIARLEALRRLSMGAAHALNNAFTTLIGEASFLLEDRKDDPELADACQVMLGALDRCAKITRALLARRHPSQRGSDVDLVRTVRELGALLHQTLGSRHPLTLELPDDICVVHGDAEEIELLVLALVHYAADHAGGPAAVHVAVAQGGGGASLRIQVSGAEVPEYAVDAFLAPELAPDAITRTSLEAATAIVATLGGSRHAERTGPDAFALGVRLPRLD